MPTAAPPQQFIAERIKTLRGAAGPFNDPYLARGSRYATLPAKSTSPRPEEEGISTLPSRSGDSRLLQLLLAVAVSECGLQATQVDWDRQVFLVDKSLRFTLTTPRGVQDTVLDRLLSEWIERVFWHLGDRPPIHVFLEPHADGRLHCEGLIRLPEVLPPLFVQGADALGLDYRQRLAVIFADEWKAILMQLKPSAAAAIRRHSARVEPLRSGGGIRYAVKGLKRDYDHRLLGNWPTYGGRRDEHVSIRPQARPRREGRFTVVPRRPPGRPVVEGAAAERVLQWLRDNVPVEEHSALVRMCVAVGLFSLETCSRTKRRLGMHFPAHRHKDARGRFARPRRRPRMHNVERQLRRREPAAPGNQCEDVITERPQQEPETAVATADANIAPRASVSAPAVQTACDLLETRVCHGKDRR